MVQTFHLRFVDEGDVSPRTIFHALVSRGVLWPRKFSPYADLIKEVKGLLYGERGLSL